jgi:Cu-processing system permease protein
VIAMKNENRIKGFGFAILAWLFFAIIYDGIFLLTLSLLTEYPLEKFSLIATIFNPIDLSRILIMLKLDISALMGYTGAVFRNFLGANLGLITATLLLGMWVALPLIGIRRVALRKDF